MIDFHCAGAILAGGRARRFGGQPKGLELVGGVRVVDRVARAVEPVVDELLLVSSVPTANTWLPTARVVADTQVERSSLVGIHAALTAAAGPVLVVGWDMPFLTADLLAHIRARGEAARSAAVVHLPTRVEACCAYYTPACLPIIDGLLARGEMRLSRFVESIPACVAIGVAEIERLGDPDKLFYNLNSVEDLTRANALAALT